MSSERDLHCVYIQLYERDRLMMWAYFSEVDGKQVAGLVPAYSRHSFASAVKTLRDRCSSHGRREGLNCVFFLVGQLF